MNKSTLSPLMSQAVHRIVRCILPLLPVAAFAQTAPAPSPLADLKDPIIPRMPTRAAWTVTYSQKSQKIETPEGDAGPSKSPSFVQATVTKDGDLYRINYAQPIAGYREIWSRKGTTLAINSTGTRAALVSAVMFPLTDFSRSDFEDFLWVNKASFKEVRKSEKQSLLFFQADSTTRLLSARDMSVVNQLKQNHELDQIGAELEKAGDDPNLSMKEIKPMTREATIRQLGWDKTTVAMLDFETRRPFQMVSGDYQVSVAYLGSSAKLEPPALILSRLAEEKERGKAFISKNSAPRP
jgi:hypothetical protein